MISLGVTSGIACYKAVDLMRDLQRAGARVRVVMTRSAAELVRPALFEALSGERVGVELWTDWPAGDESEGDYARFPHLDFARGVDAVVVAPATANILSGLARRPPGWRTTCSRRRSWPSIRPRRRSSLSLP